VICRPTSRQLPLKKDALNNGPKNDMRRGNSSAPRKPASPNSRQIWTTKLNSNDAPKLIQTQPSAATATERTTTPNNSHPLHTRMKSQNIGLAVAIRLYRIALADLTERRITHGHGSWQAYAAERHADGLALGLRCVTLEMKTVPLPLPK